MKRFLLFIIGVASLMIPLTSTAQYSKKTLYEKIVEVVTDNHSFTETELTVEKFIGKIYPQGQPENLKVDAALRGEYPTVCENEDISFGDCTNPQLFVKEQAEKMDRLRAFGRDLQMIATSYELPIHTHPDRPFSSTMKMESIVRLWQTETDALFGGFGKAFDAKVLDWDALSSEVGAVKSALESLKKKEGEKEDNEQYIAAVWRYQYGVHQVELQTPSASCSAQERGDGTELQYTKSRWCDLEEALKDIQAQAVATLTTEEKKSTVLFTTRHLGDDIYIWVRSDDVGLFSEIPLIPVLPSLDCTYARTRPAECIDGIILGGTYPAEPIDPEANRGLCSHPLAQKGYLCRAIEKEDCGETEDSDEIVLTRCSEPDLKVGIPVKSTPSGPDICRIGAWKEKPQYSVPDECTQCTVSIECGNDAMTDMKDDDGNILVHVPTREGIPAAYITIHEMAHAQQLCNQPPNTRNYSNGVDCCSKEYEAHLISCGAMASDGVFKDSTITVETCAAALADVSCDAAGYNTCSATDTSDLQDEIEELANRNPGNVATQCIENKNALDPRAIAMLDSLPMACTPECISAYKNTIGNNLCFLGGCTEESWEAHRLTPGRMTGTSTDESYPWDSCIANDPSFDDTNIGVVPPVHLTMIPPYQPEKLVRALEQALCQMNGLPTLSPPILCVTDPRRRLQFPLSQFLEHTRSLIDQRGEYVDPSSALQKIAPSIGTRIGTTLYTEYLTRSAKTLADLTRFAVKEIKKIEETTFPTAMCPRQAEDIPVDTSRSYCELLNPPVVR